MTIKSILTTFSACALLGAIAGVALPANAWIARNNAAACNTQPAQAAFYDGAGYANMSAGTANVFCPVNDSSITPAQAATGLTVMVNDGSTTAGVGAAACIAYYALPGGNCGAFSGTAAAFTGNAAITPSRAAWASSASSADTFFVNVQLPAKVAGAAASHVRSVIFSG